MNNQVELMVRSSMYVHIIPKVLESKLLIP
jgi:hypothetical protein